MVICERIAVYGLHHRACRDPVAFLSPQMFTAGHLIHQPCRTRWLVVISRSLTCPAYSAINKRRHTSYRSSGDVIVGASKVLDRR